MTARARGFTLLEIAVALAIVGIGMVACMQVFSGSLRLQQRASRQTLAVLHARTEMDKLLFDPPKALSDEHTSPDGFRTKLTVREARIPDEVEPPADGSDVDEERVPRYLEVEVEWKDGTSVRTYTLKTLALLRPADELGKEDEK